VDYIEIIELAGHSSLAVTQIYVQRVLEDPEDPGGEDAAHELLPKGAEGRGRKSRREGRWHWRGPIMEIGVGGIVKVRGYCTRSEWLNPETGGKRDGKYWR
jgi:hypothetical protein